MTQRVAFIGGGNMATAIVGGLVARGRAAADFDVVEPAAEQRDRLVQRFPGLRAHAALVPGAVAQASIVVLAVKPQQMRIATLALAPFVRDIPVVLSIAAGTRASAISRWLGGYRRIVRAMPNTPALVGAGISGLHAQPDVAPRDRQAAAAVLEACGEVLWCDREEALDAVTGVSASGPAYVFYFLEGLERAALALGFSPDDARRLALRTFEGSVKLAASGGTPFGTLRAQVTSKGGTTERAIATLEAADVQRHFVAAVKAAAARATELGADMEKDA